MSSLTFALGRPLAGDTAADTVALMVVHEGKGAVANWDMQGLDTRAGWAKAPAERRDAELHSSPSLVALLD